MNVLLDTNVVSELMRKAPDPTVAVWAAGHRLENLFFSAVGEAELRYGAAILPTGQRRETLVSDIERMLGEAFENRVLPFDSGARVRGHRRKAPFHRPPRRTRRPPDCGNRPLPPHGGCDAQCSGLRGRQTSRSSIRGRRHCRDAPHDLDLHADCETALARHAC